MSVHPVRSRIAALPNRPYSQAVRGGAIVAVSGQTPVDDEGICVGVDDPAAQTTYVLDRIEQLLADAGAGLRDVLKVTVFLSSFDHFDAVNAVYASRFAEPRPARTAVACTLVRPEYLVEIDALAVVAPPEDAR